MNGLNSYFESFFLDFLENNFVVQRAGGKKKPSEGLRETIHGYGLAKRITGILVFIFPSFFYPAIFFLFLFVKYGKL